MEPTIQPVILAPKLAMLMIRPQPCAAMCGAASRAQRK